MKVYQAQQKIEVWQKERDKKVAADAAALAATTDPAAVAGGGADAAVPPSEKPGSSAADGEKQAEAEAEDGEGAVPLTAEEKAEKQRMVEDTLPVMVGGCGGSLGICSHCRWRLCTGTRESVTPG